MTSTATTVVGWSLILGVGGIAYWQYSKGKSGRTPPNGRNGRLSVVAERQRGGSKDRRRKDKATDVNEVDSSPTTPNHEQVKNRKKHKDREGRSPQGGSSSAVDATPDTTRSLPLAEESPVDDLAFAQQLARTQSGTNLRAPERSSQRVRTNKVKSGKQEAGWQSSGTPSSQDGDADEDASPDQSPSLNAIPITPGVSGIEDMLEAPTPGPSTLRVMPPEKPQREVTPRKAKPAAEPETKKQRQRRRRREAEKEQAAIDEQERRRLMEKQLKTARTAEGTAKSGQYRTFTPPSTNAWNRAGGSAAAPSIAPVGNAGLLDTFEADTATPLAGVDSPDAPAAPVDAPSDESRPSIDSEPASSVEGSVGAGHQEPVIADHSDLAGSGQHSDAWEDYQMRTIEQQEQNNDGWTEVPAKGKKKAAK